MNQSWASQSLSRRCNTIVSESFVVPSQIKIELFSVYKEPEQFVLYDEYCKQIRKWFESFRTKIPGQMYLFGYCGPFVDKFTKMS